jgi:hypothetical protein
MHNGSPATNVYYLAPPATIFEPPARPSPTQALRLWRLRLLTGWWRVQLTAREIRSALRRFGRPAVDIDTAFLEHRADLILASSRPSPGPARILDFAAARQRLRP